MSRLAFDTHAIVKRLTQSGMDEQQAEALVECQAQLINDNLATEQDIQEIKRDIQEVKQEIKRDIEALRLETEQNVEKLRLETKKDIKELELRLTIRLGSIIVVAIGVVATLVKLLP